MAELADALDSKSFEYSTSHYAHLRKHLVFYGGRFSFVAPRSPTSPAVEEALRTIQESYASLGDGRLSYFELEVAALLGCKPHVVRDARLRGDITPTKVGGRIAYEWSEVLSYLKRRRADKNRSDNDQGTAGKVSQGGSGGDDANASH